MLTIDQKLKALTCLKSLTASITISAYFVIGILAILAFYTTGNYIASYNHMGDLPALNMIVNAYLISYIVITAIAKLSVYISSFAGKETVFNYKLVSYELVCYSIIVGLAPVFIMVMAHYCDPIYTVIGSTGIAYITIWLLKPMYDDLITPIFGNTILFGRLTKVNAEL